MERWALAAVALIAVGACVLDREGNLVVPEGAGGATTVVSSVDSVAATGGTASTPSSSSVGGDASGGNGGAGGGATLAGWSNRKAITLQAAEIEVPAASQLENFPVLISLQNDTDLEAIAQASGDDIRFTTADGVTLLDHEVERYDTGTLVAWVRMPTLLDVDTTIYMYFGNATATAPTTTAAVWDAGYAGVWHMNDPNDASDATGNGLDGAPVERPDGAVAQIGGGFDFNGNNDGLEVPQVDVGDAFTISVWINREDNTNRDMLLCNSDAGYDADGFRFMIDNASTKGVLKLESGNDSQGNAGISVATVPFSVWKHVAIVVDRPSGLTTMYLDGADITPGNNAIRTDFETNAALAIGKTRDDGVYAEMLMDEMRLSTVPRSAAWLLTSYRNQRDPGAFHTVGVLE